MRRVLCREFTDPERLEVVEEPAPRPGPGEVLLEVEAAAVSFVDGLIARGGYQLRPELPFTPGSAVAGTVASGPRAGERAVALLGLFGGFASHAVVAEDELVPVPDGVDAGVAASSMEGYGTVAFALGHRVTVRGGDRVVVLGAGGGIGLAAVDQARAAGGRVLAVASTEDKREAALAAGAEDAIGYGDSPAALKDALRDRTGGGVDVVIDPVGGPNAEAALRALGTGGRFCVIGFTSGEIPRLPANVVLLRNRTVVGVDWGDWSRNDPGAARDLAAEVLRRIAAGELHPPAPATLPLERAQEATRRYAERTAVGKLVLVP
ncbi:putative Zn-dependent oxidoreductase [Pseudonocardia sp. Ae168_Ps1]|uniref:NADPH:quinone oxidoreductase family protein n=1 Tax=unclassified Pseudonocardia TaxID=2619320 RepID=UPI00094B3E67|nr:MULTISPECIES: NADPH:quinone oxidoreductase family protein [unclassified Pseudonocardia]OLL75248.1 putative Zn-dependent oxidoreductase [Pseudonocardia sp. Ae150A_Ps1]OLL81242.1 putative Zn-dependent oxidoreductase [Pseudonocardia sp. Ae168_Ps1]OLL84643.1 putative Zn-dependent oxidoreductase [Pseudonocardia sp. Ae263_Ps1]OLL95340.1 putative Zn-dependent oxidoreductase [Pseudonocardia sp. Ae356_Ps1]